MDNKELNQKHLENSSANLQDYEIEVSDKKGFLSNLFDRFKNKKDQKLLHSGDYKKPQITNRSISSMWGLGNLRASLFQALDTMRKFISEKISPDSPKNTLTAEIISEDSLDKQENDISKDSNIQETRTPPIIPVTKSTQKASANTSIEVVKINTSAIDKKEAIFKEEQQEKSQNKISSSTEKNSHQNTIEEEHEL